MVLDDTCCPNSIEPLPQNVCSPKRKRQRDPEVAIRKWIPLTYKPKIPGVLSGDISQTIRIDTDLLPMDRIAFHGWQGRPYRSPWSFRTPYLDVTMAEEIFLFDDGIAYKGADMGGFMPIGDPRLDTLARLDGIQPATGAELIRVLHEMHGPGTHPGKIIRWDPAPIKEAVHV